MARGEGLNAYSEYTSPYRSWCYTRCPKEVVLECIQLPNDLTASILLRNSRIREGLSLDAPLYFPGHGTRLFYRVTNVSGNTISLDRSKGIAQVAFERVDGPVAHPYAGAFSDELNFNGRKVLADD